MIDLWAVIQGYEKCQMCHDGFSRQKPSEASLLQLQAVLWSYRTLLFFGVVSKCFRLFAFVLFFFDKTHQLKSCDLRCSRFPFPNSFQWFLSIKASQPEEICEHHGFCRCEAREAGTEKHCFSFFEGIEDDRKVILYGIASCVCLFLGWGEILLMEQILHQLIGSVSQYSHAFIRPRC